MIGRNALLSHREALVLKGLKYRRRGVIKDRAEVYKLRQACAGLPRFVPAPPMWRVSLHWHTSEVYYGRFTVDQRLSYIEASAKRRGLAFSLTKDQLAETLAGNACHYCGGPLNPTGGAVDRKDSRFGYHAWNSLPCCRRDNTQKGRKSYEKYVQELIDGQKWRYSGST